LGRSPNPIQTLATWLNPFELNNPPSGTRPHRSKFGFSTVSLDRINY
jgi:hypothetical protein